MNGKVDQYEACGVLSTLFDRETGSVTQYEPGMQRPDMGYGMGCFGRFLRW